MDLVGMRRHADLAGERMHQMKAAQLRDCRQLLEVYRFVESRAKVGLRTLDGELALARLGGRPLRYSMARDGNDECGEQHLLRGTSVAQLDRGAEPVERGEHFLIATERGG
jgi:hypothetical protein